MTEIERKSEREPTEREINYKSAMEIMFDDPGTASYCLQEVGHLNLSFDERLMLVLSSVLQSGVKVIDDATDKDILVLPSYGRQFLSFESGFESFFGTESKLDPAFVVSYLDARVQFPDAIINYRHGGVGHSIERPNPDYDPVRGKEEGRNPRFLQISKPQPPRGRGKG